MRARVWFRVRTFIDEHAAKITAALVVGGVAASLIGLRYESTERRERDRIAIEQIQQSALTSRSETCEGLRSGQRTDRLLIDTVLETPAAGIPLLDVPTYTSLPPLIQQYLREISEGGDPGDGETLAERLAAYKEEHLGSDDLPAFCLDPPG